MSWRLTIGMLVPPFNTAAEQDSFLMQPPGVSAFATRYRVPRWRLPYSDDDWDEQLKAHIEAAELVAMAGIDILLFACTSLSFARGEAYNQHLTASLSDAAGVPAVTTSTAFVKGLRALEAKRIVVVSPYNDWTNEALRAYLQEQEFDIREFSVWRQDLKVTRPEDVFRFVRDAVRVPADAVFVSCTSFPFIPIIEVLERDLGIPVVSANQAGYWLSLRVGEVADSLPQFGKLCTLPAP